MAGLPTVTYALAPERSNFAALRLSLALAVVVSHAFSVTTGSIQDEPLAYSTRFTLGEHAVNGFFAISGFLVTMSFQRRGWRDYVVARLLRIAPGLIVATLFVSLVIGGVMTRLDIAAYFGDPRLWRFIWGTLSSFKSAAALPGVFETNPLPFPLGTVWTLKYETLCYLGVLVAGLVGLLAHRQLALAAWVVLLILTLAREVFSPDGPKGVETALRLPLIFMTGGLIYLWADRVRLSLLGLAGLLALTALLSGTPLYKPLLFVGTAWGVLVLALHPLLTSRSWEPKTDISYGVYLYGWPVQQVAFALWPLAGALTLLAPALVVTVLLGLASWHVVEAPAMRLKRRLMGSQA